MIITIIAEEVGSIFESAYLNPVRNSHNSATYCVTGHQLWYQQGDFSRQMRSQIDKILFESLRPDQVDTQDIRTGLALPQEFA
jgi:hypothetical protein